MFADLIQGALQFPTVLFSLALGVVGLYWVMVVLGAIDLDALDGLAGADAAGDAAGEALEGVVAGDAADGLDLDQEGGGLRSLLGWADVSDVPLTVSGSMLSLVGWLVSFVSMQFVGAWTASLFAGAAVALFALGVALVAVPRLVKPFASLFETHFAPQKRSFIGRTCTIQTLRVDDHYGQAALDDGAAGLLIQVRSNEASRLARGSEALIYGYDAEDDIFHVKPLDSSGGDELA